jgi:homoserine O-acetyltransferase
MAPGESRVFDLRLAPLALETGERVEPHVVRGWWAGPPGDLPALLARARVLNTEDVPPSTVLRRTRAELDATPALQPLPPLRFDESIPTILCVHALTGDMRVGGPGGWWEPLVGRGRALDIARARVLCFNNLGSCYGTVGPADEGFPASPLRSGLPATVTTWDQARSILHALDVLGIRKVALTTGGSLGGMIALCLAALAPDRFERVAPIAAAEAASAWVIGWNHVAREALLLDPGFPDSAERGLELARQIAMLTYRAEPGLEQRHARALAGAPGWNPAIPYRVGTYLEHQGKKLRLRFHPQAYLAQLGAMDHHDLGREPGSGRGGAGASWGLDRIRASTLSVDIRTDQLFFPEQMRLLTRHLRERRVVVDEFTIDSPHGHDAFLIEWDQVATLLARALALPAAVDNVTPIRKETQRAG